VARLAEVQGNPVCLFIEKIQMCFLLTHAQGSCELAELLQTETAKVVDQAILTGQVAALNATNQQLT